MPLKVLQQGGKKYAGADKRAGDVTGQAHKADCAPVDYGPSQNKGFAGADGDPVHQQLSLRQRLKNFHGVVAHAR